jgi:hypothetical protein
MREAAGDTSPGSQRSGVASSCYPDPVRPAGDSDRRTARGGCREQAARDPRARAAAMASRSSARAGRRLEERHEAPFPRSWQRKRPKGCEARAGACCWTERVSNGRTALLPERSTGGRSCRYLHDARTFPEPLEKRATGGQPCRASRNGGTGGGPEPCHGKCTLPLNCGGFHPYDRLLRNPRAASRPGSPQRPSSGRGSARKDADSGMDPARRNMASPGGTPYVH